MGVLIAILAILFLTLIIVIPLIEKHGREYSEEELTKMSGIIRILMIVFIVVAALRYFI